MRKLSAVIYASAGAIICLAVPAYLWYAKPENGLISPVVVTICLLGITGFISAVQYYRTLSPQWLLTVWFVCGGLIASMFITVMSVAPIAFLSVLCFAVSAVRMSKWSKKDALKYFSISGAGALLIFTLLFLFVISIGVDKVDVPNSSFIESIFPSADYKDAFQIKIPAGKDITIETLARIAMVSMMPSWADNKKDEYYKDVTFEPGSVLGGWQVYLKSENEVIVGLNRSYIDLRLSVFYDKEAGFITLTTLAKYNNLTGRLYFIPVKYGHQIVLADTARKMKERLLQP